MRNLLYAILVTLLGTGTTLAQTLPIPSPGPARDAQAQQKKGTARLAGRVVSVETSRPLRRAQVRASSPEIREGRSVSTDANGMWEIKDLPPGRYSINVQKGGYVPLSYGQRRPFEQGKPVDLADGQSVEKLDIALPRGSVITGRIVDEFGEPVSGARVSAMRFRLMGGQRRLMPDASGGGSDTTDDIGQYRLHGLSPGDYYVSASISGAPTLDVSVDRTGYAATYYPGTASIAEAQRVAAAIGQETTEISFALSPTQVATISGTAVSSAGKPLANAIMYLTSPSPLASSPLIAPTMVRPDGTFTMSNIAPGEYRLETQFIADIESVASSGTISGAAAAEAASIPLTVTGRDITGFAVVTAPTSTATGKFIFDGSAAPTGSPASFMVRALPDRSGGFTFGGVGKVRDDWSVEIKGLSGRRIVRAASMTPGWTLKSVVLNEVDVTDEGIEFKPGQDVTGLEITMTQRAAKISGEVLDRRNQPVTDYVVVAFSSDPRKWGYQTRFVRSARPDQSGKFLINGLPPDDYLLVALEYLEPGEEGDPELLERLRGAATTLKVTEGEAKSASLKLAQPR